MHQHTDELAAEIAAIAQELRIQVLEIVHRAGTGHLGGSFSAAEIVAALYFHQLRVDPAPRTGRIVIASSCRRATRHRSCMRPSPGGVHPSR